MTTRRNFLSQSPILSPNPLVMTITVNELNGNINSRTNRPTPHLQAIVILSKVIIAQVEDSLRMSGRTLADDKGFNAIVTLAELMEGIVQGAVAQAAGRKPTISDPFDNPPNNPADNPPDNPEKTEKPS